MACTEPLREINEDFFKQTYNLEGKLSEEKWVEFILLLILKTK